MASLLLVLAAFTGIMALLAQFWLVTVAFRTSLVWGLVCLFMPCGVLFFVLKNWDEAKRPFAVSMTCSMLCGGMVGVLLAVKRDGLGTAPQRPQASTQAAPAMAEPPRDERLRRACEAARAQVHAGAPLPPLAAEGWVVTLWLASRKGTSLRDHPALAGAVEGGRLTPAADEELARVSDGTAQVIDGLTPEAAQDAAVWNAAALEMGEGYARMYLEGTSRPRFVALADRLRAATGAEIGALHGRCAHLKTHELGAWFQGPDAAGAATALVYRMGFFTESAVVNRSALGAIDPRGGLEALSKAAAKVKVTDLAGIVAPHQGTLQKTAGVRVTFPLLAPMRATAASRSLARKMGVGVGTD